MSIPTELFTWEMLATLAGAATAVFIVVQLTKQFVPAFIPVRLYAWVLAWGILTVAALVLDTLTWQVAALNALNGAIIALTSMGEYAVANTNGYAGPRTE
jgi:hypothetical protein